MIKQYTISRDDSIYEAWPDLILTKSGKLICPFTECRHHGDRHDSRIVYCESVDRGRSWSKKHPLSELSQPPMTFNNSRIMRFPDDTLGIVCDRVDGSGGGENGPDTVLYLWRGDSEGEHWGEPKLLPFCGIVPDKIRVLSTGRQLLAAHNRGDDGKLTQYLWYSDDNWESWSERITVAHDARYNLCEASILELGDGELVCFMRENSGQGCDCLKAFSRDHGESWDGVYRMPIPAVHRPVAGFLQSGRIMMTYRFLQGGRGWLGAWTQNFFAAFFDEESAKAKERSEQSARIFPIAYDRSPKSDLGYSGWVQFDDGEIYVATYIVDDAPSAQIRGYSFTEEDVLLPQ